MVEFQYAWLLIGLPLILLLAAAIVVQGRRDISTCLLLSAAALALLAGSGPYLTLAGRPKYVNVVIDNSAASATAFFTHPRLLRGFLQRHMASAGTPPHVRLWSAGQNILPISGLLTVGSAQEWPSQFAKRDAHHANWSALAQISSHEPMWIFSTVFNRWPTASPGKAVAVTLIKPSVADIGVRSLAARHNRRGRVDIAAVIHATAAIAAIMRISRDGHLIAAERMVFPRAGTRVVSLVDSAAAGQQLLAYHIRLDADDPWPQDNGATVVLPPRRLSHVLWVDGGRPRVSAVKGELRIAAANMPNRARNFLRYSLVVLDDVSANKLTLRQADALRSWLHDGFGGLVILGANRAFGPGGYGMNTAVARRLDGISPLSSRRPSPSPVGVIFLLDASGSMGRRVAGADGRTRFDLAAEGMLGALHVLGPAVRITVLAFSGRTIVVAHGRMTPRKLLAKLDRIAPNGPTRPDTALPLLQKFLHRHDRIILLTDGGIGKISVRRWDALLKEFRSKLGVIAERESAPLRRLLSGKQVELVTTHDMSRWSLLLRRAAARAMRGKTRTSALAWQTTADVGLAARGITRRWARVFLKRQAILLAGNARRRIPLAAYWHYGTGKVAAMGFEVGQTRSGQLAPSGRLLSAVCHLVRMPATRAGWHLKLQRSWQLGDKKFAGGGARHWRLRITADRVQALPRHLYASVLARRPGAPIAIEPIGAGIFQGTIATRHRRFGIGVWMERGKKVQHRDFIGRIWPRQIAGPWFPATGTANYPDWRGVAVISQHGKAGERAVWHPEEKHKLELANPLWIFAALCGLLAMAVKLFGLTIRT